MFLCWFLEKRCLLFDTNISDDRKFILSNSLDLDNGNWIVDLCAGKMCTNIITVIFHVM